MIRTRVGNLVKVKNQDKKKTANSEYYSVIMKKDGAYIDYLFTDVEINVAKERARKNGEDRVVRSFISNILD